MSKSPTLQPLPYQEKVLLHLLRFVGMEDMYQVDRGVTQGEISRGIGLARKHLPRALAKLVERELLTERRAHVSGVRQIRRVYFLTWKGEVKARQIRDAVRAATVQIQHPDGPKVVTVEEVQQLVGIRYTLIEILGAVNPEGSLDLLALTAAQEKEAKRRGTVTSADAPAVTQEDSQQRLDIYREALENAWLDGKLTINETIILDHLRQNLGISDDTHAKLEREALQKIPLIYQERIDVYRVALAAALKDFHISKEQQLVVEALRERLKITVQEHEALVEEIMRERTGAKGPPSDLWD